MPKEDDLKEFFSNIIGIDNEDLDAIEVGIRLLEDHNWNPRVAVLRVKLSVASDTLLNQAEINYLESLIEKEISAETRREISVLDKIEKLRELHLLGYLDVDKELFDHIGYNPSKNNLEL
ncbi:MAG: hypothetical protein AAGA64_12305 [Bacteroidota bacterium]